MTVAIPVILFALVRVRFLKTSEIYLQFYTLHEIGGTRNAYRLELQSENLNGTEHLKDQKGYRRTLKIYLKNRAREKFIHLVKNTWALTGKRYFFSFPRRLDRL
jgi:hypothetical protein